MTRVLASLGFLLLSSDLLTYSIHTDVKYLQFGREINLLAEGLKRIETIVQNADAQHPRRPWHKQSEHVGTNMLQEVTGDFLGTLNDCQTVLDDNSKFHRNSANFVDNVLWWSATEREVNALRERVHFHVTKVTFIAKPFETQLLLGIRRELQQLRRDVADLKGVVVQSVRPDGDRKGSVAPPASSIPDDLVLRFKDALYVNKPKSFDMIGHLPLKEAFDALIFNFANSTVEFYSRPELGLNIPEEPQYVNLLKARWIASNLEESYYFQAAGSDSLWADYLRELKDDIRDQFRRFESGTLIAPSSDVLSRLPDTCFSIWVVEQTPPRPPDLAEQRPLEEKVLELALPSSYGTRQSALTVFRRSDIELRLVSTTKDTGNKDFHREEGMDVNMHLTRLIPAYANPDEVSKETHNILLCTNQGQTPKWYTLKDADSVARLQQALLGYRVFHDMSGVAWAIEGSSKPHKNGKGKLQLWHHKPLRAVNEVEPKGHERKPSTVASPHSPSIGGPKMQRYSTGMSGATLLSANSITSSVSDSRGDGTALLKPEPPILVIMTMCERKYTFLHIRLERNVSIKPELCQCRNPKKACRRVILGGTAGVSKNLDIRRHRAEQEAEQGLFSWDLARFRWPQHSEFKKLEVINKKYICLDFPTMSEKDQFLLELNALERLRNLDLNSYDRSLREKKYLANNPGKVRTRESERRPSFELPFSTDDQSLRSLTLYDESPIQKGVNVLTWEADTLCLMVACSGCERLPALLFVRPYSSQRRWDSSGEIQQLEAPVSDIIPQWPQSLWLDDTPPGRLDSLSPSMQALLKDRAVSVELDQEEMFFTMEQSKKDQIWTQTPTEDRLQTWFDLLKITLYSCPDAFAEPFWFRIMALCRPIIETTIMPFLSVLEWKHLESHQPM